MGQIQPFGVPSATGKVGPQGGYPRYHGHSILNTGTTVNEVSITDSAGNQLDFAYLAAAGSATAQSRVSIPGGVVAVGGVEVTVTGTAVMTGSIYIA